MRTKIHSVASKPYANDDDSFCLKMHDGKLAHVGNMSLSRYEELCEEMKLYHVEVIYSSDLRLCYIVDVRIPRSRFD